MSKNKNEMTVNEHFKELRNRVFVCLSAFLICFVFVYCNATTIISNLLKIGENAGFTFAYLAPQEALIQALRISGVLGLMFASPVIIGNCISFVLPIFEAKNIKRIFAVGAVAAEVLFVGGILFCVGVLFPFVFKYLRAYSADFGLVSMISIEYYFNLFLTITIVIGTIFETPLFSAILGACGVITAQTMIKIFKPAIIVILVISAFVTPPDVISMLMVAIPMIAVYSISILVCKLFGKKGDDYE